MTFIAFCALLLSSNLLVWLSSFIRDFRWQGIKYEIVLENTSRTIIFLVDTIITRVRVQKSVQHVKVMIVSMLIK